MLVTVSAHKEKKNIQYCHVISLTSYTDIRKMLGQQ